MFFTLIAFAVALGVLITFHELGHYWVARRCGVRVLRFSVGFGKVLARRVDRHGTEWAFSAIPLGGYVKMLDEAPAAGSPAAGSPVAGSPAAASAEAFNQKSLLQRSAIVVAGPVANLLLAVLLYAALGLVGTQEPAPVLAVPPPATAAALAGFQEGDRITHINGQETLSWGEARWQLLDGLTSGGEVRVQIKTASGMARERQLQLARGTIEPEGSDLMAEAGLSLAAPRAQITEVLAGGAGEQYGLRGGDIIVAVGQRQQPSPSEMVKEIQGKPGTAIPIKVLRDGTTLSFDVTPQADTAADGASVGRIGVLLGADFPMVTVSYGLFDSLQRGVVRTFDTAWFSLKMMGRMVVGDVSLRNVSGPVTIADYAGQTARIGWAAYVGFLALISVSIGVLNLLPIPMLDGGHLMYYAIEAVRGKPVPEKWMEAGQRIGLGLLAGLMGLAFFNDFMRLFS